MKKIIIIDNYDSFTYNLVHAIQEIVGHPIEVVRNDVIDYDLLDTMDYIVLSPGPGIPEEAGDLKAVIKRYAGKKKMLGVCLGQQAIAEVFGATIKNLDEVYHGVQTPVSVINDDPLFAGIPSPIDVGRYHSWVVEKDTLSNEFIITSEDDKGEIMSMRHKELPIYAVQFHPESILTPTGEQMLANFLEV